jgi:putative aldouronate transport system substrate-binding protein
MKKTLSILLTVVLVIGLLVGCAGNTGTTGDSNATGDPKDNTDNKGSDNSNGDNSSEGGSSLAGFHETGYPIVDEPMTFTCFNSSSIDKDFAELKYFKVLSELTNVNVEFTNTPDADVETKLNLLLASGDLPDFFFFGVGTSNMQKYGVEGGMFHDYVPYIDKYMPNLQIAMQDYPLAKVAITEMNDEIYSLPYIVDTTTVASDTLYLRTDMLGKVGKEVPKTIDEFYQMLVAFKEANWAPDFSPFLPTNKDAMEGVLFNAFGDATDPGFADEGDGKTVAYNYTSEQFRLYLEFVNKLYTEGLLEKDLYAMDANAINAKVKEGKGAVVTAGTQLTGDFFESGKIEEVMISPMTSQYTDKQKIRGLVPVQVGGATISKSCENPEVLARYFDIAYSKEDVGGKEGLEGLSIWLGIRGEDWEYSGDNNEYFKRIVPEGLTISEEEYRQTNIAPGSAGWGTVVMAGLPYGNPSQEMKGSQSVNNLYPYMVQRFPETYLKFTAEESEVLANKYTEIKAYVESMKASFITGTESLDNWDKYVDTINQMGIEEVLKVYQAAYDRLNAIVQ